MRKNSDCDSALADALEKHESRVLSCFMSLGEERAMRLRVPSSSLKSLEKALAENAGLDATRAHDIAFHLTDWIGDAAFLVALHLYPERFDKATIAKGISILLAHAPNHLAAAAKLFGMPIQDIFDVDALQEDLLE
jgi:hypothetical protein